MDPCWKSAPPRISKRNYPKDVVSVMEVCASVRLRGSKFATPSHCSVISRVLLRHFPEGSKNVRCRIDEWHIHNVGVVCLQRNVLMGKFQFRFRVDRRCNGHTAATLLIKAVCMQTYSNSYTTIRWRVNFESLICKYGTRLKHYVSGQSSSRMRMPHQWLPPSVVVLTFGTPLFPDFSRLPQNAWKSLVGRHPAIFRSVSRTK